MVDQGKTFLLVPAGGGGEGMGHMERCISLARRAGGGCSICAEFLDDNARQYMNARAGTGSGLSSFGVIETPAEGDRWDFVVMDKRKTSVEELRRYSRSGTVVCLDGGGEARRFASYTMDAMPSLSTDDPPNIASLSFLELPKRSRTGIPSRFGKVLVTFGGEDRADLSGSFLESVIPAGHIPPSTLVVAQGPLFRRSCWPLGVEILKDVSLDPEILAGYDLVITHYGLTALRSMALGIPVVLFNPTKYHRALGRKTGIPDIGVGRANMRLLAELIRSPDKLADAVDRFARFREQAVSKGLLDYLLELGRGTGRACPACGYEDSAAVARFTDRTYYSCSRCGIIHMESFRTSQTRYDSEYFDAEYKRQYGKTYLEDFQSIKRTGISRIKPLRRILGRDGMGTVVDVGCAYGPFLEALRDSGFTPVGVDISREAVDFVRGKIGVTAVLSDFEGLGRETLPPEPIRAITLWYVIEHFRNLEQALRKASSLLAPDGILAFSTPNGDGITARKSLREFLENSPADHFTVLHPRTLRRFLRRHGFELRILRVTGHHPERFPAPFNAIARGAFGKQLLAAASLVLGLGDTFEAYAVKRTSP